MRGQLGAARQVLARFQTAGRGSGVHAYLLAAQLALFDDRVRDAARLALGAARVVPDDLEARCAVAGLLLETGETSPVWPKCSRRAPRCVDGDRSRHAALRFRSVVAAQTQWRANGKAFFIDKQPPNWVLAAAIHAALPGAPILHLVRAPVDTCFSNWRAYFGNPCAYSYGLATLAAYYRD